MKTIVSIEYFDRDGNMEKFQLEMREGVTTNEVLGQVLTLGCLTVDQYVNYAQVEWLDHRYGVSFDEAWARWVVSAHISGSMALETREVWAYGSSHAEEAFVDLLSEETGRDILTNDLFEVEVFGPYELLELGERDR